MRLTWLASCAFALSASAAAAQSARPTTNRPAEELYKQNCVMCHMPDGNAAIPQMNFADGKWIHGTTPKQLALVITNGVPGTAMPAFPSLSDEQTRDVVAFVGQIGKGDAVGASGDEVKKLFATHCASCHGATGLGDGFNAPTLPRAPTNFHLRQPSNERAAAAIGEGMAGTAMPSWKAKLSPDQIKQLAEYARSFYVTAAAAP